MPNGALVFDHQYPTAAIYVGRLCGFSGLSPEAGLDATDACWLTCRALGIVEVVAPVHAS